MVKDGADGSAKTNANRRLKKLLKDALPRPDQAAQEQRRLADFHRPKFGAKGMAVTLTSLAWHSADRAHVAANAGDAKGAEAELSEAFRRAYWSRAVLQKEVASTLSVIMLEAYVRGCGLQTLMSILKRELEPGDPHKLFGFASWALRLVEWDGPSPLFQDSPYLDEGAPAATDRSPEAVLQVMCTWHLQVALREAGFSPFMFSPYIVLPVEVLAWSKKREQVGLPVPALDHPLLGTPIAKTPLPKIELAPKGHELLEALFARCLKDGVLTAGQIDAMSDDS